MFSESDLCKPVKAFLEKQGHVVKGEVPGCDVVAVKDGVSLIVELKQRFTLELLLQGVERLALTDLVYLAVPEPSARSRNASPWDKRVVKLCRRVGVGLLTVSKRGRVDIIADPEPYRPRKNRKKAARLLSEHARRAGDPNLGGITRIKIGLPEAGRVGVARRREVGETPLAFVELKPSATATETEIIEHTREHLAHFKCPREVIFAVVPKTSTGKIQKFQLREQARSVIAIE